MGKAFSLISILIFLVSNNYLIAEDKLTESTEKAPLKAAIDPDQWKILDLNTSEVNIRQYVLKDLALPDKDLHSKKRMTRFLNLTIPTIELNNLDLYGVVRFLEKASMVYSINGEWMNITVQNKKMANIHITINAKNLTIRQVLEKVSTLAEVDWIIRNNQVIIGRFSKKKMMVRKFYKVNSELALEIGNNVKDFFLKKGLSFSKGSSIQLTHNHRLFINNLPKEHAKLTAILLKWANKEQFAITAQLFEINDNYLKKDFELKDLLSLPSESFKILDVVMTQSLEGKKGLTRKRGVFLEAMCRNYAKGVWHCHYQWSYKEAGKNFALKDKISIAAIGDKIIDLGLKKDKRYILLLSARRVGADSKPFKRKTPDALQPSGQVYIFHDERMDKKSTFLPKDQDQYIENYNKLKKTK